MVAYKSFYVAYPTPELLGLLEQESDHIRRHFVTPFVVEKVEGGRGAPSEESYLIQAKLLLLAFITSYMEVGRYPISEGWQRFMVKLFGEPPYHIRQLERWWRIERTLHYYLDNQLYRLIKPEILLDCYTDDPEWNEWREEVAPMLPRWKESTSVHAMWRDSIDLEMFPTFEGEKLEEMQQRVFRQAAHTWIIADIITQISRYLTPFVYEHDLGRITHHGTHYYFTQERLLPELAFITKERLPEMWYKTPLIMPDLVVEVISLWERPQDINEKLAVYRDNGVTVWIVNPMNLTCAIQHPTDDAPIPVTAFTDERLLPGFMLPAERIFPAELRRIIEKSDQS